MTDWLSAMRARHSVRRYRQEAISDEDIMAMRQSIINARPFNSETPAVIALLPFSAIGSSSAVGAVAVFNPAPWYLVAYAPQSSGRMEEIGFRMEQVILAAASLGLGTCWIGGMFQSGLLSQRLGCQPEDIIAISPLGKEEGGLRQRVVYNIVEGIASRGGKRKQMAKIAFWQKWAQPLPSENFDSEIYEALEMARIAPSWSNLQPWYFLVGNDKVLAIADSRPKRTNTRPGKPYYRLDVGIAMAHFWLARQQQGHESKWHLPSSTDQQLPSLPAYALIIGEYNL